MTELIIAALIASCLWWAGIIARHLIQARPDDGRDERDGGAGEGGVE